MGEVRVDKFREECGVVGIYGHPEVANLAYLALYALQHRGQESAGIVTSDGESLHLEKAMGLVDDVFSETKLRRLKGSLAIGHVRYSTTGTSQLKNAQPLMAGYLRGQIALAHNGNLTNAEKLRHNLEAQGSIFGSTTDSEVIVHLIARSREPNLLEASIDALSQIRGAYSLAIMNETELLGARDPYGFRPLSLGKLGDAWILASESCAFDLIEAQFVRDIEPGEIVQINESGVYTFFPFPPAPKSQCIFEYVYFSRPDSFLFGRSVAGIRKELGRDRKRSCRE